MSHLSSSGWGGRWWRRMPGHVSRLRFIKVRERREIFDVDLYTKRSQRISLSCGDRDPCRGRCVDKVFPWQVRMASEIAISDFYWHSPSRSMVISLLFDDGTTCMDDRHWEGMYDFHLPPVPWLVILPNTGWLQHTLDAVILLVIEWDMTVIRHCKIHIYKQSPLHIQDTK